MSDGEQVTRLCCGTVFMSTRGRLRRWVVHGDTMPRTACRGIRPRLEAGDPEVRCRGPQQVPGSDQRPMRDPVSLTENCPDIPAPAILPP